jgi:hypothetical protein
MIIITTLLNNEWNEHEIDKIESNESIGYDGMNGMVCMVT